MANYGRPPLPQYWANIASPGQVQTDSFSYSNDSGTANVYVVTLNPAITSYQKGLRIRWVAQNANTGASTLNANGLGAVALVHKDGSILQSGDIQTGSLCEAEYDGTHFQLTPVIVAPNVSVRQTVASGPVTSQGYANHLAAGTGLGVNLSTNSGANPVVINYAAGSGGHGNIDYVNLITSDVANAWSNLPANSLNFLYTTYSLSGPAYGSTLALPQYGYTYNQSAQSVLQFGGAAGSTTFLDDFGNTWAAVGGGKVQTNQVKFGTGALGGSATNNAVNLGADGVKSMSFTSLGNGGWSLRFWVYFTALGSAAGSWYDIAGATNGSGYGATIGLSNQAGAFKMHYALSSTGSSNDITATYGSTTVTTGNWYFVELTYDSVAGKYFGYVNGALDYSVTSSSRVCGVTQLVLGNSNYVAGVSSANSAYFDKPEFLPYCQNPNGTGYSVPTSAPSITAAGYASNFFSIPLMTMYSVSGASAAAGSNPTFTAINRAYHGEVTTNGTGVASVTAYAYNGKYDSGYSGTMPAAATRSSYNHNLGISPKLRVVMAKCLTAEAGFSQLDEITPWTGSSTTAAHPVTQCTRNTIAFTTGNSNAWLVNNATGGTLTVLTNANWSPRVIAERGW